MIKCCLTKFLRAKLLYSRHMKHVFLPCDLNIDNYKHVIHRCHWFSINVCWLLFLARAAFKVHRKLGIFLRFFCFFSPSCLIAYCDCSGNSTSSKARKKEKMEEGVKNGGRSEKWSIKPAQRAFVWWSHIHLSITMNTVEQKKKQQKLGQKWERI